MESDTNRDFMRNSGIRKLPQATSGWFCLSLIAILSFVALLLGVPPAFADVLPDHRAYELVSPPDTGTLNPIASPGGADGFDCFETSLATNDGEHVSFMSAEGGLEGMTANGVRNLYESSRTPAGWATESKSATGQQTTFPVGGLCESPDHQYSTLLTGPEPFDKGSLVINGEETSYIREPGGSYQLIGAGSVGTDLKANVKWIANAGAHIILTAKKRLEPQAPVGVGTAFSYSGSDRAVNAVYDRNPLGLNVVSLLPNGQAPSSSSETTFYRGVSNDGTSVVFEVIKNSGGATLYEHREVGPTVPIVSESASGDYRYGGMSEDGSRVLYIKEGPLSPPNTIRGDIFLFDANTGLSTSVTAGTEAAIVNFSEDGSHVYFTTEEALPGSGDNPLGESAQAGAPNLYAWDTSSEFPHFIATVAPADVEEDLSTHENLTEWIGTVVRPQQNGNEGRSNDPSRTTPDGSVFLFQAHGNVTGYSSGAYSEVYRYDENANELSCVSCPPGPAASDAALQKNLIGPTFGLTALVRISNVTDDGRIVFFLTGDSLVPEDINETYDVYEWEEGTVSLISSGRGSSPSLLYAMSSDGRNVFFLTTDRLVPQDESSVLSIYDARVDGGFPAPVPKPTCEGDPCQGTSGNPPLLPLIDSEAVRKPEQARSIRHHKHKKHRKRHAHHRKAHQ